MTKTKFTNFNTIEMLVIGIVILSAVSLTFDSDESVQKDVEISAIDGTLSLPTRSSMDSLGLDDFRPGRNCGS